MGKVVFLIIILLSLNEIAIKLLKYIGAHYALIFSDKTNSAKAKSKNWQKLVLSNSCLTRLAAGKTRKNNVNNEDLIIFLNLNLSFVFCLGFKFVFCQALHQNTLFIVLTFFMLLGTSKKNSFVLELFL